MTPDDMGEDNRGGLPAALSRSSTSSPESPPTSPGEMVDVRPGDLLASQEIALLDRALLERGGPARCSDELAVGMDSRISMT